MKRENLRKILEGDDEINVKIDNILDAYHSELEPIKRDLEKAQEEKKSLEEELSTANNTIGNLEKDSEKSESVAQEIEKYKSQIDELMKARDAERVNNAIELAIIQAKGKNTKAIRALLDHEKIRLEHDGSVSGIEDQLKMLEKTDSYMFETEADKEKKAQKVSTGYKGPKAQSSEESQKKDARLDSFIKNQNKQNEALAPKPLFGDK